MSFQLLDRALRELENVLLECEVKLIVGGGFGLFLLQNDLQEADVRTIIERDAWCVARVTADIDILLETSIIANLAQFQAIRSGLDSLKYEVIPGVKYMHFEKYFSERERVEINFLTGPIQDAALFKDIHVSRPRVRPRGNVKLHAYLTQDVVALSESIQPVANHDNLFIPSSLTFLIMKLHAFRDRFQQDEQEKAGHHAMDVYRVVSMMTEVQHEECKSRLQKILQTDVFKSAALVVEEYFDGDLPGILKIREHPLYRRELRLDVFCSVLREFFL